jgi:DNA mismatch repair protein MutS2
VEELARSGAAVCVTTHYEPLKEQAALLPYLENGAVGFDFDKMEPTFRVEMGRPGASSAIIVAQRHGLPASITDRALALMPEANKKKREDALSLEQQTLALNREKEALAEAREEQERLNRQLALELEKAKAARLRDLGRESDALRSEVGEARAEVRRLRQAMKNSGQADLGGLQRSLDQAAKVVAVGGQVDRDLRASTTAKESVTLSESEMTVGRRVQIAGFQETCEILQPPRKGQVLVLVGVMKMSVPLSDIYPASGAAKGKQQGPANQKKSKPVAILGSPVPAAAPIRSQDVTLDLRGVRVEEGLLQVDHFVDELLRRQEMGGFVLHGHGTGAMKDAVRSHLRGHSCITNSRPAERDEGGDAFTVFWLYGA